MAEKNRNTTARRLLMAFISVILLFIAFGVIFFLEMRALSTVTRTLYDHPLVVSNASLHATVSMTKMHRSMKDVTLFDSPSTINSAIIAVNEQERVVFRNLDTVKNNIIGSEGQKLENETRFIFDGWKPIREEVINLVLKGQREKAAKITMGKGAAYVAKLENKMLELTTYARNKATGFMSDGERLSSRIEMTSIFLISIGVFLLIFIAFFTIKRTQAAQEALRNSLKREQFLGDIVRNTSVAICIGYPNGRLGMTNTAFHELTDYNEKELKTSDWNKVLTPPEWRDHEIAKLEELHRTRRAILYQKEYIRKDGSRVPIELVVHPQLDEDENIESYFAFVTDMTERKQAEEALRESEERYRDLYEKAPNAYFSINAFDGSILRCNSAALQLLGYDRETIMKLEIFDLYADTPNGLSKAKEAFKSFKAGESIRDVELQMKHKDGHPIWISLSVEPVRDRAGNIIESRSMVIDISERKRAEEVLRESEEKYRTLFTEAPDMIHIVDENGRIIVANWKELETMGYTREEYFGKNIFEVIHPDYRSITKTTFESVLKGESIKSYETAFVTKYGDKIDVEVNAVPQFAGERIVAVRAIIRDIRERKRTDEILKASLKEKGVLLSEIHHRVKNNMQVISSLLKIQSDKIQDKEYADMFKESNDRIRSMSLVHEKLYQSEDFANVDFNGYAKSLVNSLFRSYGIDTNKIKAKIEVEGVSLRVDTAVPCGLLINELVSNSLKHAFPEDRRGEISIALRSINEDKFELIVSDNGIGIPEGIDFRNTESFGLELISILAEDQLDGQIELDRTAGTRYQIRLKRQKYRPRI